MVTTQDVVEFARQAGADVFGVANIDRFAELPPEKHPCSIFPEARSVIVLGRRIPRGALRGVEEGTNFTNYAFYGCQWLDNRFTSLTTFQVSEFLEDNGWEAVPLPNLPPEVPPMGVKVRPDSPAPNVMLDMDDAAVRAGVGEIGYCGVLLTPRFGPRQRIQAILTQAELEPTPLLAEPICPRDGACKAACPLGAFVGEKELTICGRTMTVAQIDQGKCEACKNGARPNVNHPAGKPDRIAAVCVRTCMDYLEVNKRIGNLFATPFRQRDVWTVKSDVDFYSA